MQSHSEFSDILVIGSSRGGGGVGRDDDDVDRES